MEARYLLRKASNLLSNLSLSDNICRFLFFIILIGLWSCSSDNRKNLPVRYFQIDAFFHQQAEALSKSNIMIEKSLFVNEKHDTLLLKAKEIDWDKEFTPFMTCDINKPAYSDAYQIESIQTGIGKTLRYTAVKPSLFVQFIEIVYDELEQPASISIKTKHTSMLSKTETELWFSYTGYGIREIRKSRWWGDQKLMVIEAYFIEQP
ncbi:MAG: hypothetical protein LC101_11375 [Flavobacteriales bacterium]|nr:hypothetical protein [Flavobacteriales bacterium]